MLLFSIKVLGNGEVFTIVNSVGLLWSLGNQYILGKHLLALSSERLKSFYLCTENVYSVIF